MNQRLNFPAGLGAGVPEDRGIRKIGSQRTASRTLMLWLQAVPVGLLLPLLLYSVGVEASPLLSTLFTSLSQASTVYCRRSHGPQGWGPGHTRGP